MTSPQDFSLSTFHKSATDFTGLGLRTTGFSGRLGYEFSRVQNLQQSGSLECWGYPDMGTRTSFNLLAIRGPTCVEINKTGIEPGSPIPSPQSSPQPVHHRSEPHLNNTFWDSVTRPLYYVAIYWCRYLWQRGISKWQHNKTARDQCPWQNPKRD